MTMSLGKNPLPMNDLVGMWEKARKMRGKRCRDCGEIKTVARVVNPATAEVSKKNSTRILCYPCFMARLMQAHIGHP